MKPLVIYHANCADGFGAAFAAWLKFGNEAEYLAIQYGQVLEQPYEINDREIYILDFSMPKDVMDCHFQLAKKVVWLDHHKTAFEMWCEKERVYYRAQTESEDGSSSSYIELDNNKAGAMIAWEYFHPGKEIPMLIKHIDDYDRWVFALDGTKEFNKALWSYAPWSFEQWKDFLWLADHYQDWDKKDYWQFIAEGSAILRAHEQNVQAVVKLASRSCCIRNFKEQYGYTEVQETKGLAANCPPHLTSDVGHQLANQSKTYGLLWYINKEGKCLCSLRSNGDYDVSTIAKAFGGGGHKNAAGFEIDTQTLLEWIK